MLLLGVDGGGTYTRAAVAAPDGRLLGRGEAGSANTATAGAQSAGRAITAAVAAACAAANAAPADIGAGCFGMAGLDRPDDEPVFRGVMEAQGLGGASALVNDAVIAWAAATGGAPGIAVVAGTGSIAYGRNARGGEHRAGGWGAPIGDEGSAYWIACEAIRLVLAGVDRRLPPTALAHPLAQAAGLREPADLCLLARADGHADGRPTEAALAALAPVVAQAAAEGQPEAEAIVRAAARHLVRLAGAVAHALGMRGTRPDVFGLGSVLAPAAAGPTPVARAVDRMLRRSLGVPLRSTPHPPLAGALALAHAGGLGHVPDPQVLQRWAAALCGS